MMSSEPDEKIESEYSDALLNAVLELVTEWGENYGKPINERILAKYPDLSPAEIDDLTKRSREAEHFIYKLAEQELDGDLAEMDIVPEARKKFAWLDGSNAARLKNIGMFYARK
jgi:hypothetical protein